MLAIQTSAGILTTKYYYEVRQSAATSPSVRRPVRKSQPGFQIILRRENFMAGFADEVLLRSATMYAGGKLPSWSFFIIL